ncbi:MAG TPA: hypothetical protein VFR31_12445 [Thermoanaerobaculia bacterium]|nr:hypothetical protein [Thermoanaerobaculia bacterium]
MSLGSELKSQAAATRVAAAFIPRNLMTTIASFVEDSRVAVFPFSRQDGGEEEMVIGRPDVGVFLALPREAVRVLEDLAAGKTVGEARDLYHQRHGETPDMTAFLELLSEKGFVRLRRGESDTAEETGVASRVAARKYHFENIPKGVARFFFGSAALCVYTLVIAVGAWIALRHPSLVPGRGALYFERLHTPKILTVIGFSFVTLFFHEMSHLVAAHAVGVKSRLSIGHRLWVLVAETDLTGLWAVPKKQRYLPLLAGPLTDLATTSGILLCLQAATRGWLDFSPLAIEMLRAIFFAYVLQLVWQLFFFVRTDLYYAIATLFDCKNLLGDTETFLKNRLAQVVPSIKVVDQSHIPVKERRVIRAYALVWLLGRALALFLLFAVTLPLTFAYLKKMAKALSGGWGTDAVAFVDALSMMILSATLVTLGMGLWIRSLIRQWKPRALAKQIPS